MRYLTAYWLLWGSIGVLSAVSEAQLIRPIRDNVGYCWTIKDTETFINALTTDGTDPGANDRIAGISPHDDYLYAGRVYYPLFRSIKTEEVIIFGVTHGTVRKEIGDPAGILLFDAFREWKGVRDNIKVSRLRDYITSRLDTSYFKVSNTAHTLEHSIEGQLPFLQYYNPHITITPIMVTAMAFERMDLLSDNLAGIISGYIRQHHLKLGRDIFFLISSDANHYGKEFKNTPFGEDSLAHLQATGQDKRIANDYLKDVLTSEKLKKFMGEMKNVVWCGKYSVPFGILTTQKIVKNILNKDLTGEILRYSDTYTEGVLPVKGTALGTTAPSSLTHWCGFLSAAFYAK